MKKNINVIFYLNILNPKWFLENGKLKFVIPVFIVFFFFFFLMEYQNLTHKRDTGNVKSVNQYDNNIPKTRLVPLFLRESCLV